MEVVIGTYEELILGFKLENSTNGGYELKSSFSDHTHTGCVKTVALNINGILAAGSSDERISVFNLKKKKEIGTLMHHDGSITCLTFYGKRHMFSASEDGTIGIWQTGNWECLRTLRGHKEAVYWIAVHPSGKLALSVGKDKTLRTWNLITGRQAYVTNIKQAADSVCWCPSGEVYAIVYSNKVDLYKVETSELYHTIKCDFRVQSLVFLKPGIVAIGGDGGHVEIVDTNTTLPLLQFNTDTIRVKAMQCCQCPSETEKLMLITGSSDGYVKVWSLCESNGTWAHEKVAEHDTKFRIVSLAIVPDRAPKREAVSDVSAETSTDMAAESLTNMEVTSDSQEEDKPPKKKKVKQVEEAESPQEDSKASTEKTPKKKKKKVKQVVEAESPQEDSKPSIVTVDARKTSPKGSAGKKSKKKQKRKSAS